MFIAYVWKHKSVQKYFMGLFFTAYTTVLYSPLPLYTIDGSESLGLEEAVCIHAFKPISIQTSIVDIKFIIL